MTPAAAAARDPAPGARAGAGPARTRARAQGAGAGGTGRPEAARPHDRDVGPDRGPRRDVARGPVADPRRVRDDLRRRQALIAASPQATGLSPAERTNRASLGRLAHGPVARGRRSGSPAPRRAVKGCPAGLPRAASRRGPRASSLPSWDAPRVGDPNRVPMGAGSVSGCQDRMCGPSTTRQRCINRVRDPLPFGDERCRDVRLDDPHRRCRQRHRPGRGPRRRADRPARRRAGDRPGRRPSPCPGRPTASSSRSSGPGSPSGRRRCSREPPRSAPSATST